MRSCGLPASASGSGGSGEGEELVGLDRVDGVGHDPERQRVERREVVDEAAASAVEAVGLLGIGVEEHRVPAPLGHLRTWRRRRLRMLRQKSSIVGRAREQPRQPHDRDPVIGLAASPRDPPDSGHL